MPDPQSTSHPKDGHPILAFPAPELFERYLDEHAADPAVWVRFAKKANPSPSMSYAEAMDVALCVGWVDGQAGRDLDDGENWYLQRFSPRKPRSVWSQINVDKVERLVAEGRMRAGGLAAVERAKANGYWDAAYAGSATIEVPPDLRAFLDEHSDAAAFFAGLDSQNRFAILFRLQTAVRPQTRASRFDKLTAMLLAGEKPYP